MNLYLPVFSDLTTRLRWRLPVLVAWTAAVGLTEGISIVLLLPLLSRVGMAVAGNQGRATRLIDAGLAFVGANTTVAVLAVVIVVATMQVMLALALNWWSTKWRGDIRHSGNSNCFGTFMRAKWGFFADHKAGELTNAIITECERLGRAFTIGLSLFGSVVVAVIYAVLSLVVAWQATVCSSALRCLRPSRWRRLYKKSYAVGASLGAAEFGTCSLGWSRILPGVKFIKASDGVERATALIEPLVRKLEKANAFAGAVPGNCPRAP